MYNKAFYDTVFCTCVCERDTKRTYLRTMRESCLAMTSYLTKKVCSAKMVYLCVFSFSLPFLLVHAAKQSKDAPTAFLYILIPL